MTIELRAPKEVTLVTAIYNLREAEKLYREESRRDSALGLESFASAAEWSAARMGGSALALAEMLTNDLRDRYPEMNPNDILSQLYDRPEELVHWTDDTAVNF